MKIDMSKAFDRVKWIYIDKMMAQMGFSKKWRSLISNCLSLVQFSVLVNGTPRENFKPRRGIRQGDPLSPYLFLICAEGLSPFLNREESLTNLKGFKINKLCLSLTHLFFANDNLIFCRATEKECKVIKDVLGIYKKASGQTINLNKSMFMANRNVKRSEVEGCERILGIKETKSLGNYLGMPSQNKRKKEVLFRRVKEKIWKTLQSWKGKLFSIGGKKCL